MKSLISCIFFFALTINAAFSTVEIDVLNQRNLTIAPEVDQKENRSNCHDCEENKKLKCPDHYKYLVSELVNSTFYSTVTGKNTLDKCIPKNFKSTIDSETLSKKLGEYYGSKKTIAPSLLRSCLQNNRVAKKRNDQIVDKLLISYSYNAEANINLALKNKLAEIASADQLLKKDILNDIDCGIHHDYCEELKKCPPQADLADTAAYSTTIMLEVIKLENQLTTLRQEGAKLNHREALFYEHQRITRDIESKKEYLYSMAPWLQGDIFRKKKYDYIKKVNEKKDITNDVQEAILEQTKEARAIEKETYIQMKLSKSCLIDNQYCTNKLSDNINTYINEKIENPTFLNQQSDEMKAELGQFNTMASCLSEQKRKKDGVDDIAVTVGSTISGFAIGGAGGVLRLGSLALKFYQRGNMLTGIASGAALSVQGKLAFDSFQEMSSSCSNAMNHLEEQNKKGPSCSVAAHKTFKLSNLTPCIVNIAATTIPTIAALKPPKKPDYILKEAQSITDGSKATRELISNQTLDQILKKYPKTIVAKIDREDLLKRINDLELNEKQTKAILENMNKALTSESDIPKLKNYLNYIKYIDPDDKARALGELSLLKRAPDKLNKDSPLKAFLEKENRFDAFERMTLKRLELQEKTKEMIKGKQHEIKDAKHTQELASSARERLEKNYYACQSKIPTPEHTQAVKRYMALSTTMGVGSTVKGNYNNNQELYQENKSEWVKKVGYEVAMVLITTKINAKILAGNKGSYLKKYLTANAAYAGVGLLDATTYSALYGITQEEAAKRLEEIFNSEEAQKEIHSIERFITENDVATKLEQKMVDNYRFILSQPNKEELMGPAPYTIGGIEFSKLDLADLEDPKTKELLVEALVIELNTGANNPILSTGNLGADRWVADRAWQAAVGVPKSLLINGMMLKVLCVGADNPVASFGVAASFQFMNQMLTGDLYYKYRKAMIGQ